MLLVKEKVFSVKKVSLVLALCFSMVVSYVANAADSAAWTLAAEVFSFTQSSELSSAQQGISSLLPQLILEQISSSSVRMTSSQEMLDRKLSELQTERISLFLQLSKEVKTRDSLLLSESNSKKLQKALKTEEEKIKEIEEKIKENLADTEKAKEEVKDRIEKENEIILEQEKNLYDEDVSTDSDSDTKKTPDFVFNPFRNPFEENEESLVSLPQEENISLYKNDFSTLFSVTDDVKKQGIQSYEYEKAVTKASINGLIGGTITVYGEYAMVTATLYIFPGAKKAGTITEVGTLDNCVSIAQNIARYLVPKITNSMPITLYFDITPEECRKNAKLSLDSLVYQSIPDSIVVDAGIHTIEVSCKDYNSQSLTYTFQNRHHFLVHIPLDKTNNAEINLTVKNPKDGSLYENGFFAGDIGYGNVTAKILVNGEPVIGQYVLREKSINYVEKEVQDENGNTKVKKVPEEGENLFSFYYIDSNKQLDNINLMINPKPHNNSAVIDKRRIWMYRGYTALVLSVPLTLYTTGQYVSLYNSNVILGSDVASSEDVEMWSKIRLASLGITAASGAFFVFELVRYLKAASSVLPVKAKIVKESDVKKAKEKSLKLPPLAVEQEKEEVLEENIQEEVILEGEE